MDFAYLSEPRNLLDILEGSAVSLPSGSTPVIGSDETAPPGPAIGADETPGIAWGPVVGSDETPNDGQNFGFAMNVLEDETGGPSDPRLKRDVECVGKTVLGLNLYRFRYLDSDDLYEGVMADEVLALKPAAVSRGADGFLRVHYDDLGLEMRKVA